MHPSVRGLLALIAAATLLTGCVATPVPTVAAGEIRISSVPGSAIDRPQFPDTNPTVSGLVAGLPGGDLTPYLSQRPVWSSCNAGTECATVLAPLDYADPSGRAVTLALRRKPATKSPKLGTLFIDPGGPGGSGRSMVPSFHSAGLEQYDIVGWDPRGTGASTPVRCFGSADADAYNNLDNSPDTDAERAALIRGSYAFAASCWEHSGVLLEHISTIETVRDLDLLRRLLGDTELHFLGYSYGTQIGATYAELFPGHVGRMVLDSAVKITNDDSVIQAMGFDLALGDFATWCAENSCELGSSKQEVLDTVVRLLDRLDGDPLLVGQRRLTQSLAATGIVGPLYSGKDGWTALEQAIADAARGNGKALLYFADGMDSRNGRGDYGSLFYSFPAIGCLDSAEDKGLLDADRSWLADEKKAPIFGRYMGPGYLCAVWPVRPAAQLTIHGAGAKPIVVVGATGDPATPYQQAVSMAKQLDSGVLVTYEGEGHGTYGGTSQCVDRLVVAYLVNGTVPVDGVRCT